MTNHDAPDWSLLDQECVQNACLAAAKRAARRFRHISVEEALQDTYLWVATHRSQVVNAQARYEGDDLARKLASNIYAGAIRRPAVRESNREALTRPYEEEPE